MLQKGHDLMNDLLGLILRLLRLHGENGILFMVVGRFRAKGHQRSGWTLPPMLNVHALMDKQHWIAREVGHGFLAVGRQRIAHWRRRCTVARGRRRVASEVRIPQEICTRIKEIAFHGRPGRVRLRLGGPKDFGLCFS